MWILDRNQKGFTLIELMIVVAIIGILAAIAIPNFLKYQAKSRQAEAKINLAGIYVAETSYFGEQARYGSFAEVGFALMGSANRYTYRSGAGGVAGGVNTGAAGVDTINAGVGGVQIEGTPAALNSDRHRCSAVGHGYRHGPVARERRQAQLADSGQQRRITLLLA